MVNDTYSVTTTQELENKIQANLQEWMLQAIQSLENWLNSKFDQKLSHLQEEFMKTNNLLH